MFFSARLFKELNYLDKEQLEHIARVANEVLDANSSVVYGRALDNGAVSQFSTVKDHTDTHVALLIGAKQMAMFDPEGEYIRRDRAEAKEEASKDTVIENQRKELERLRDLAKRVKP